MQSQPCKLTGCNGVPNKQTGYCTGIDCYVNHCAKLGIDPRKCIECNEGVAVPGATSGFKCSKCFSRLIQKQKQVR
jgi:DNA-directed RNA polymerase subunit RPC12/RpoP